MKKIYALALLFLVFQQTARAQQEISIQEVEEDRGIPEIPFIILDQAPIYPGCEGEDITDKTACFQQKLYDHISANFRYPEEAKKENIQGRVFCKFLIDETGKITNITVRGSHELLENEARRITELIPNMLAPGQHGGKIARTPYSLPLTFKL
ncbi:energy transducer TonB [Cellulophaga sp. HaHa_2_1]|uniref:energy transducer TonB n=1 Tax=Cellulophaga sp. HaHa_2_1 TaxID=2749994 RepID=UPI001C4FCEC3|nr:energy transducer TonB [Cellulophaga sp. HaHa_2_1]QXP51647.1 energy transducer TonB [Cellulophaga sp. HaHa_2_1]